MFLDDGELAVRARAGDNAAIGELYRRHYSAALRSASRYATFDQWAEDLVAEAFSRMLLAWRQGRGPQVNIAGYLAVAIRNAAFTHYRRTVHPGAARTLDPSLLERHASSQGSALDELLNAEAGQLDEVILGKLHPRWRQVLILTLLEVRDREIALHLGLSVPAVRALRFRARQAYIAAVLARPGT